MTLGALPATITGVLPPVRLAPLERLPGSAEDEVGPISTDARPRSCPGDADGTVVSLGGSVGAPANRGAIAMIRSIVLAIRP